LIGRVTEKILGLILLGLTFGTLYLIYGKHEKYDQIIEEYEVKGENERQQIYKSARKRLLILFLVCWLYPYSA